MFPELSLNNNQGANLENGQITSLKLMFVSMKYNIEDALNTLAQDAANKHINK